MRARYAEMGRLTLAKGLRRQFHIVWVEFGTSCIGCKRTSLPQACPGSRPDGHDMRRRSWVRRLSSLDSDHAPLVCAVSVGHGACKLLSAISFVCFEAERSPARERWNTVPLPPPCRFCEASLSRSGHAEMPNVCGHPLANLRTAVSQSRTDILSLRPFLSEPQDFARLVRFP